MTHKIRKAVIPVAGVGSRLLPLTKALPKEMLPIGAKPVIQHTVEELVDSGIREITIVVSHRKHLVQQHFAPDGELEMMLHAEQKDTLADAVRHVSDLAHVNFLYQDGPYGNGTPILNASRILGDEPVMVLWADDVFVSHIPRAQQLKTAYEETGCPVLALMPMDPQDSTRYGVPIIAKDQPQAGNHRFLIEGLVEKPKPADAPSPYAAIGGYVITPDVIHELENQTRLWHEGHRDAGEIYLTDALNAVAARQKVYGQVIDGTWWDTGTQIGYLKASFAAALASPEYGSELTSFVRSLICEPQ